MKKQVFNPYLPSYEYIPDGEPYIFDGRLYIYGSHDKFNGTDYCENDYVCWSASLDNLADWKYEGVIFRKEQHPNKIGKNLLFAPDVVKGHDERYYLYYSVADSSIMSVAVCDSPAGKYEYYGDVSYPSGEKAGEKMVIFISLTQVFLSMMMDVYTYIQAFAREKSKMKRGGFMLVRIWLNWKRIC